MSNNSEPDEDQHTLPQAQRIPATADNLPTRTGTCLCGAVQFKIEGQISEPDACHCRECRKQSGHYWASCDIQKTALTIIGEDKLKWYRSSEKVQRGFCSECGSSLFWDPIASPKIAVAMGAIDAPTGTKLAIHIFTGEKGDYYEIADGLEQHV